MSEQQISGAQDVLDRLKEAVRDEADADTGKVTIGTILDAFGSRSYGPFLLVPALIELSPIGGIPGVPTVIATFIFLTAVQMLMGREHVWVPQFFQKRNVAGDKVNAVDDKVRPAARWLDNHTRERMHPLMSKTAVRAAAVVIILLCLTVPPLELIPFASSLPMAAIAAFGLALLVKDGLLMLLAFIVAACVPIGLAAIAFSASS
jgi:hypothetical protein